MPSPLRSRVVETLADLDREAWDRVAGPISPKSRAGGNTSRFRGAPDGDRARRGPGADIPGQGGTVGPSAERVTTSDLPDGGVAPTVSWPLAASKSGIQLMRL